jgi:hypothetical protein
MPRKTTESTKDKNTTKQTKKPKAISQPKQSDRKSKRASEAQLQPQKRDGAWHRVDLHLHTPGSHDYEQPDKTYIDILKQAEKRGLSMIAFTDHNTVNGYRNMHREIEQLEMLERTNRIRADEQGTLNEYRRLLKKIVVLPGFEFTATFGFHILGIFSPAKSVRDIEHVLMQLRVPGNVIDKGLTEAGATSDVLTAYRLIDEADGIAIAAHANSSNGVSMRNMNLGGQTRIAFTQDEHLLAIEFTDLEKGRRSSANLFTGIKPEYPRKMFAIQGSDAHRVTADANNPKRLGVGDRATEYQIDTASFDALRELFQSDELDRARPIFDPLNIQPERDDIDAARTAGASATVAFHPALSKRGERFEATLKDACAMANGDGGVIFIGCDAKSVKKIAGVDDAKHTINQLASTLAQQIAPILNVSVQSLQLEGKTILKIDVPRGKDAPYVLNQREFFVRHGAETVVANRDDIVAIARRSIEAAPAATPPQPKPQEAPPRSQQPQRQMHSQQQRHPSQRQQTQQARRHEPQQSRRDQINQVHQAQQREARARLQPQRRSSSVGASIVNGAKHREEKVIETPLEPIPKGAPKTGVQVVSMEERNGTVYFGVRDLRNNSVVRNVTFKSARDLWHYAIMQHAEHPSGPEDIDWSDNRAVLAGDIRAGRTRYDIALRDELGRTHVFYGVIDEGLDDNWRELIANFKPQLDEEDESFEVQE